MKLYTRSVWINPSVAIAPGGKGRVEQLLCRPRPRPAHPARRPAEHGTVSLPHETANEATTRPDSPQRGRQSPRFGIVHTGPQCGRQLPAVRAAWAFEPEGAAGAMHSSSQRVRRVEQVGG